MDRVRTAQGRHLPVIALTRRGDLKTKLAVFERGVDDILTVPFSPEELVARTLAVMRRSYSEAVEFTPILRLGDLEIDILNRRVRVGGTELHLTSLEQSLLYLLAANAGRLLTRDEILDNLWGADYVAEATWSTATSELWIATESFAAAEVHRHVRGCHRFILTTAGGGRSYRRLGVRKPPQFLVHCPASAPQR